MHRTPPPKRFPPPTTTSSTLPRTSAPTTTSGAEATSAPNPLLGAEYEDRRSDEDIVTEVIEEDISKTPTAASLSPASSTASVDSILRSPLTAALDKSTANPPKPKSLLKKLKALAGMDQNNEKGAAGGQLPQRTAEEELRLELEFVRAQSRLQQEELEAEIRRRQLAEMALQSRPGEVHQEADDDQFLDAHFGQEDDDLADQDYRPPRSLTVSASDRITRSQAHKVSSNTADVPTSDIFPPLPTMPTGSILGSDSVFSTAANFAALTSTMATQSLQQPLPAVGGFGSLGVSMSDPTMRPVVTQPGLTLPHTRTFGAPYIPPPGQGPGLSFPSTSFGQLPTFPSGLGTQATGGADPFGAGFGHQQQQQVPILKTTSSWQKIQWPAGPQQPVSAAPVPPPRQPAYNSTWPTDDDLTRELQHLAIARTRPATSQASRQAPQPAPPPVSQGPYGPPGSPGVQVTLSRLIKQRHYAKTRIWSNLEEIRRLVANEDQLHDEPRYRQLKILEEKLLASWKDYNTYQDRITATCPEDRLEEQYQTMEDVHRHVLSAKWSIKTAIGALEAIPRTDDTRRDPKVPDLKFANLKFSGQEVNTPVAYLNWLQAFKAGIDNNSQINSDQKLTYLKESLSGQALSMVMGFCRGSEYETAMQTLDRRYGQKEDIITSLYQQLMQQQPVADGRQVDRILALSNFHLTTIMTLSGYGVDVSEPATAGVLLNVMLRNYPQQMRHRWVLHLQQYGPAYNTVQNLVSFMQEDLRSWEKVVTPTSTHFTGPAAGRGRGRGRGRASTAAASVEAAPGAPETYAAAAATQAAQGRGGGKPKQQQQPKQPGNKKKEKGQKGPLPWTAGTTRPCTFCDGEHYPKECTRTKITAKLAKIKSNKLCAVCGKDTHITPVCYDKDVCHNQQCRNKDLGKHGVKLLACQPAPPTTSSQ